MTDLEITNVAVTFTATVKHQTLADITLRRTGHDEYMLTVTAHGHNEAACRQRLTELKNNMIDSLGGYPE